MYFFHILRQLSTVEGSTLCTLSRIFINSSFNVHDIHRQSSSHDVQFSYVKKSLKLYALLILIIICTFHIFSWGYDGPYMIRCHLHSGVFSCFGSSFERNIHGAGGVCKARGAVERAEGEPQQRSWGSLRQDQGTPPAGDHREGHSGLYRLENRFLGSLKGSQIRALDKF
jgi:hypothetical protein